MSRTIDLRWVSFGSPAAIVTSMALIVGLDAAANKAAVVGSLLIIGVADNLTDSLSVHIYQESERLAQRQAFRTTVANYAARLATSLSFVFLFLFLPTSVAVYVCVVLGFFLLSGLTYLLAEARRVNALREIYKHAAVAAAVRRNAIVRQRPRLRGQPLSHDDITGHDLHLAGRPIAGPGPG